MRRFVCPLLLMVLLIASCTPQAAVSPLAGTATTVVEPTQPVILPSATAQPSPTPEQGKLLLVAPAGSDAQAVQAVLAELSAPAGLALEVLPDLQAAALGPQVKVVVMLSAPGNLNELLAAAPQAQFAVVSGADLPAAGNLSVIRLRPENQAFLSGFISVLLSTDWRAGSLLPSNGPLGAQLQEAFINGGGYFCGLCGPGWPLGVYYPQVSPLPSSSDGPAWQAAAAGLYDNMKVEVYYLSAEAQKPEVFSYLQGREQFGKLVLVVGDQPPPDELRGQWAATVGFDAAASVRQLWPDLLAGKGGALIDAALEVSHVNPDHLGEGRQRLVNELMNEIQAGRIYPFTLPQQ